MTTFTATTASEAVVSAERSEVWDVLTDPQALPVLTPLLDRIEADGDLWRWEMSQIPVLRTSLAPCFTEKMSFTPQERIDFTHAPQGSRKERAGVEGWYILEDHEDGTKLSIKLEMCVDLPLPRAAKPVADRVMRRVIDLMGDRFSANLLRRLGATQKAAA